MFLRALSETFACFAVKKCLENQTAMDAKTNRKGRQVIFEIASCIVDYFLNEMDLNVF
jgi:hypothetical protein